MRLAVRGDKTHGELIVQCGGSGMSVRLPLHLEAEAMEALRARHTLPDPGSLTNESSLQ